MTPRTTSAAPDRNESEGPDADVFAYNTGSMPPDERAAFEARMRLDGELAARAEVSRHVLRLCGWRPSPEERADPPDGAAGGA